LPYQADKELPQKEIDLATKRMNKFKADPERHAPRDEEEEEDDDG
jgi:hypothetical protein